MKTFVMAIVIILAIMVVAVWACLRMAGAISREEEKEDGANHN